MQQDEIQKERWKYKEKHKGEIQRKRHQESVDDDGAV